MRVRARSAPSSWRCPSSVAPPAPQGRREGVCHTFRLMRGNMILASGGAKLPAAACRSPPERSTPSPRTDGLCRPPPERTRWTKPSKRLTGSRRELRRRWISETTSMDCARSRCSAWSCSTPIAPGFPAALSASTSSSSSRAFSSRGSSWPNASPAASRSRCWQSRASALDLRRQNHPRASHGRGTRAARKELTPRRGGCGAYPAGTGSG